MTVLDMLYAENNREHNQHVWNVFPLLSPKFSFLRTEATKEALAHGDRSYPLDAVRFVLFPGESDLTVNDQFRQCINRGVTAINELTQKHLGMHLHDGLEEVLTLPLAQDDFNLFDWVNEARLEWERGTMRVQRIKGEYRERAYQMIRAIELGYRIGTLDASPDVQNSIEYFEQAIASLDKLLGFKDAHAHPVEWPGGPSLRFDTNAGVVVYSYTAVPMRTRHKYAADGKRQYSSLLMKIYTDVEYPNDIRDYIGAEIIVKDDEARERLIEYIRRKTRLGGAFEGFKDTAVRPINSASDKRYGAKKFFLRVPARLQQAISLDRIADTASKLQYRAVPIEVQILILDDAKCRDQKPETTHAEYKRRQFMRIFPALFPREIYESEMRRSEL